MLHHLQHELSAAECQTMQQVLDTGMAVQATVDGGLEVDITPEMVRFEQVTKKVTCTIRLSSEGTGCSAMTRQHGTQPVPRRNSVRTPRAPA